MKLIPRLGLALPRYYLRLGSVVHAAAELKLFCVQTTLLLSNDLTGQSELQLTPGESPDAALETALTRIAAERDAFGDWLIMELPGWRDEVGQSPFWQALGARFFKGDPIATEARLGPDWRSHLAALLPRQTVYLSFLGAQAEACAGRPADQALFERLLSLGFERAEQLRIDDGGPVLRRRLTF